LYAEYWGYDDHGTPDDDTDDEHLYFIRWYVLRDSLDTNASSGTIRLYDPELNPVYSWDITALRCLEHNEATDGLRASAGGIKHGVIVPVPVSVMQLGGEYRFLLQVKDDHVAHEKAHRLKPALELNSKTIKQVCYIWVSGTSVEYLTSIRWDYVTESLRSAELHGFRFTEGTQGALASVDLRTWRGVFYYALSDPQKRWQRAKAKEKGWADARTLIITKAEQGFGGVQKEDVARIEEKNYARCGPDSPAVAAINGHWLSNANLDAEQELYVRANAVLHEITHLLNDRNKDRCKENVSTCVWSRSYSQAFTGRLQNRVTIRSVVRFLPWHALYEINEMRKSTGWDPLSP